jgi:hypothetical protein
MWFIHSWLGNNAVPLATKPAKIVQLEQLTINNRDARFLKKMGLYKEDFNADFSTWKYAHMACLSTRRRRVFAGRRLHVLAI